MDNEKTNLLIGSKRHWRTNSKTLCTFLISHKFIERYWDNLYNNCLDRHDPFEKYLNKSTRGIKKYKNNQNISYQNLLFSNCIIKKSVFDVIKLNLNLKYYGGEELDFASKLEKKFPKMMTASTEAVATRINFPDYKKHLYKLIEFGELNLQYLDNQLKRDVIKFNLLLKRNVLFRGFANLLYYVCRRCYKMKFMGNYIIKIGMLSAILKGYYKTK